MSRATRARNGLSAVIIAILQVGEAARMAVQSLFDALRRLNGDFPGLRARLLGNRNRDHPLGSDGGHVVFIRSSRQRDRAEETADKSLNAMEILFLFLTLFLLLALER